jgi:hypothetical protein
VSPRPTAVIAMAVEDALAIGGLCIDDNELSIVRMPDAPPYSWWRRTVTGELVRLQ